MEGFIVLLIVAAIFLVGFWDYFSIDKRAKRKAAADRQKQPPVRYPTPNLSGSAVSDKVRMAERSLYGSASKGKNDLATFSMNAPQKKSRNKTPVEWVLPSKTVHVKGDPIPGGLFYFGGKLNAANGMGTDACLVDPSLSFKKVHWRDPGDMGYWPHYNNISDQSRGAYLSWLASDRNDPKTPIGLVFLYFYGLERRILIDSIRDGEVPNEEFETIGTELRRLIDVYKHNQSFRNYSVKLLAWMKVLRPDLVKLTTEEVVDYQLTIPLSMYLGKMVKNGKPMKPRIALTWLYLSDFLPRTPAQRCKEEFEELFLIEYAAQYGQGMVIKPNKKALTPQYFSASPSIGRITLENLDLPDPMNLPSVATKLQDIAARCTNKLDRYSRYLGKDSATPNDLKAIALLPDELCRAGKVPILSDFHHWAQGRIKDDAGMVLFEDLWHRVESDVPEKLTKKDLEALQMLLDKSGIGMAPDARHHHAKPELGMIVSIFEQPEGSDFTPSKSFNDLAMALRLGSMVATIDGHVHEQEVQVLRELIKASEISEAEQRSAQAYLDWRLQAPQSSAKLKAQIEQASDKSKEEISQLLITVAMADGKISPDEIKELEKLYTRLGLDKALLSSDIHTLNATGPGPGIAPASKGSGFELNERLIAQRESETQDAQGILGAIFAESDEPESEPTSTQADTLEDGMDEAHSHLYHRLITQSEWPRAEVEALCDTLGLMTDGALETINDWAFEQIDEPVIDSDDDPIEVDLEIVQEIANL